MSEASPEMTPFPAYTYVPGHAPHPISDPDGHMRSQREPSHWSDAQYLLWGQRLFNAGFYWEAHEAWEHLWLNLKRTTPEALTAKGLIKLAASAVKCREGNSAGAMRHAIRATELLKQRPIHQLFAEVNFDTALSMAEQFSTVPPINLTPPSKDPVRLIDGDL